MQWRKASEGLPEKNDFYYCKVLHKNRNKIGEPFKVSAYYNKKDGFGTDTWCVSYDFIEWLDETPTTQSGWPGEDNKIFALQFWWWVETNNFRIMTRNQFATHGYINTFDKVWQIQELMEEYLKSHTPAPKAEDEKYWIDYGNDGAWLTAEEMKKDYQELLKSTDMDMEEIEQAAFAHFSFKEGEKEHFRKILKFVAPYFSNTKAEELHRSAEEIISKRNWSFDIKRIVLEDMKTFGDQFKQSPSIKRPTVDESKEEYSKIFGGNPHASHYDIWNTCFSWLLSLQSDNKI